MNDSSKFENLNTQKQEDLKKTEHIIIEPVAEQLSEEVLSLHAQLLNTIEQSVFATDLGGIVIYWNRVAEQLYGWLAEEAIGRNVLELTTPKPSIRQAAEIMTRLRQGKSWTGEFIMQRKDGTTFPAQITNSPIYDKQRLIGIIGLSNDITERKLIEKALRVSETRYRSLLENANDIIYSHDLLGNYVTVNGVAEKITGYSLEELKKMNITEFIVPEHHELIQQVIEKKLYDPTPTVYEFDIITKDGHRRTLEANSRVSSIEGERLAIEGVARDITERKQAEEELRRQRDFTNAITTNIGDGIYAVDQRGLVTFMNLAAEKILGWNESEMLGKNMHETIHFQKADGTRVSDQDCPILEVLKSGKNVHIEDDVFSLRDGSIIPIAYTSSPIITNGQIAGAVLVFHVITERKRTEKALQHEREELEFRVQERTKELEKANKERVEILHQLVTAQEDERKYIARELHDQLGQEMTVLRLKLDVLKKMCDNNEELCKQVDEIQMVARQLDSDVDFLAWKMRPTVLDDIGIVAALDQYIRQWSAHFNIPVEFNAERFSKTRLKPEIESNFYRITQEALNNIYKHAKASKVNVLLEPRDGSIVLIIEDNGVGFETGKKISVEKGMGLVGIGERAALIGGKFEIESTEGAGTTLYVSVPV
ncbi:MAG: PAS domain S-box protein [Acidobacteriota bacterium]|nr:PAS domain S-box protein [Acidobacteriota bacterium]